MRKLGEYLDFSNKKFSVFSDGPYTQFKNRYLLAEITVCLSIDAWYFFATAHGKWAVDGVGGTVKRIVYQRILFEGVMVKSADDFCNIVSNHSDITAVSVSVVQHEQESQRWTNVWHSVEAVDQISKLHVFILREHTMVLADIM